MSDQGDRIEKKLDQVLALLAKGAAPSGGVASDEELDGQYGDPQVRKDPTRWKGQSYVGCNFSCTAPDYLEALASLFDWKAGKDKEKAADASKPTEEREKAAKYARYSETDARRARGWAKRLRDGWKAPNREEAPPPQEEW